MVAHSAGDLSDFQNGEERLVYARYSDAPRAAPYYLHDGQAAGARVLTREHLECPMPECGDRRLKAVSRRNRRDGFSHHPGAGGHSAESLFHQEAKALLQCWLLATRPDVEVRLEASTPSGESRADVMVSWPDGQLLAIEIQYSDLTVAEWERRHNLYRDQGIADLWLLGHTRPQLRLQGEQARLGILHTTMATATGQLHWINPITATVATPYIRTSHWGRERELPIGENSTTSVGLSLDALSDCTLTPEGFTTPTGGRLAASREDFMQERDRRRRDAEVYDEQEHERRRKAKADREARKQWIEQQRADRLAHWHRQPLYQSLVEHYGAIPDILALAPRRDPHAISAAPEHWHTVIYRDLIHAKTSTTFTIEQCWQTLRREGIRWNKRGAAAQDVLLDYLEQLRAEGVLRFTVPVGWTYRLQHITVVADLSTLEAVRAHNRHGGGATSLFASDPRPNVSVAGHHGRGGRDEPEPRNRT